MDEEEKRRREAMRDRQMSTRLTERDLDVLAWLRGGAKDITDEFNRRYEAKQKATNALHRLKAALRRDDPSST